MLEILFKAKRVKNGEWIHGYYLEVNGFHFIVPDWNSEPCGIEVFPETVCQYTGLNDNAGNKVFESDVLSDQYGDTGVVRFGLSYGVCGFFLDGTVDDITENDLLIIGNIHDKEATNDA